MEDFITLLAFALIVLLLIFITLFVIIYIKPFIQRIRISSKLGIRFSDLYVFDFLYKIGGNYKTRHIKAEELLPDKNLTGAWDKYTKYREDYVLNDDNGYNKREYEYTREKNWTASN